ncbi:ASCH domain-containing protein [Gordonia otitidis]|uniref:ASCH domain-containing protein n=1 Tax=Gordonia otitidis (strain DSM 44809 / CCUG 52243 / JCM 12355 / NBRC 100426 / IFM 10032) TaxID=1108044 RepID=H5TSK3_GORO1|nr:ASCH domain-containing protein [Gordonia otitidis]GAB36461.1 hypothetical protein GOOTI_221_00040 [Gordonia otitidis NBRC 100426]
MTSPAGQQRPLRAFTVHQPYAWSIVHGTKNVENRTRNIAGQYRGLVAIHAGKTFDPTALDFVRDQGDHPPTEPALLRGHIIGVVELVDVTHHHPSSWALPDHLHLVLVNPRPLPTPLPYRGALGLWTPAADTAAAIHAQLRS